MFNPLHSSMNQELSEKHLYNQSSYYESMDDFCYIKEAIMCYHQINMFSLSAKKGGQSLYIPWYAEVMSNSENIESKLLSFVGLKVSDIIS